MSVGHSKQRTNPKTQGKSDKETMGAALPLGQGASSAGHREGTHRWQGRGCQSKCHKHIRDEQGQHRNTEHSCGTEFWRNWSTRSAQVAKIPSLQNAPGLVAVHEFPFANGPCSVVCAEGPPPCRIYIPNYSQLANPGCGIWEMDVQNPNRIPELIKVQEVWLQQHRTQQGPFTRGKKPV